MKKLFKIGTMFLGFVKNLFKKQETITLEEALKSGQVLITARKKDGSIVERLATKKQETIKELRLEPKGVKETASNVITFVDLHSNSWKSFIKSNILSAKLLNNNNIIITH